MRVANLLSSISIASGSDSFVFGVDLDDEEVGVVDVDVGLLLSFDDLEEEDAGGALEAAEGGGTNN